MQTSQQSPSPRVGMQWAEPVYRAHCEHCQPLRSDTNVLVLARLTLLHKLSDVNLCLSLLSIIFFSVNLVLLVVTYRSIEYGEKLVDGDVFHRLDFGSAFLFALVEVLTLVYSPERRFTNPLLLKVLMFANVCSTFTGLLFMWLNRGAFETLAHNIDYCNELSMALIDALLVSTIVLQKSSGDAPERRCCNLLTQQPRLAVVAATFFPIVISGCQLLIYNGFGVDARGHVLGELAAHVLEFVFNTVGATINFWFCLDSKFLADTLASQIMIARPAEPPPLRVVVDPNDQSKYEHSHNPLSPRGAQAKRVPWPSGMAAPPAPLTEFLLPETLAVPNGNANGRVPAVACGCGSECEECSSQPEFSYRLQPYM